MPTPRPFSRHERLIAWRYLRARREEGGVSVMTWISLIGIALAVFALIATLAVRSGFRAEFVDTIVGANAHVSYYAAGEVDAAGNIVRTIPDYTERAQAFAAVPDVTHAAPLIQGQVMASHRSRNAGVQVLGIHGDDLAGLPRIVDPQTGFGDLSGWDVPRDVPSIALGAGVARTLGVSVGDTIRLISPDGVRTPFGTSPRVSTVEVVYVFSAGRYDIDQVRAYMPFAEAQRYFNRDGVADVIEIRLSDPERLEPAVSDLARIAGSDGFLQTWQDASSAFLRALAVEDNVMFVILSVLVLIAAMNIVSGLIMLVKNKGRDIGILRTIGLSEAGVTRVFFLCGASVGIVGTAAGTILGCLFAIYIDLIFAAVNALSGGGVWDPSIRGIYYLPARLEWADVASAVGLSLSLSFLVTILPARRAARLDPVEALRGE